MPKLPGPTGNAGRFPIGGFKVDAHDLGGIQLLGNHLCRREWLVLP